MHLVLSLCSPSRSTSRTSITFSKISLSVGHCSFRYIAVRAVAGKTSPPFSFTSYPSFPHVLGSVLFSEMPIKTLASGLVKGQATVAHFLQASRLVRRATAAHSSRLSSFLSLLADRYPTS